MKPKIAFLMPLLMLAVFATFATTMPVAYASPKSLYLVAVHYTAQFDAWAINPDGTATYQFTVNLIHATDPAGISMDESSNTLFITSEFSLAGFELVDATTMTTIGTAPGPYDLAGIDVDDANDIVYTVERWTDDLYVYDWDPTTNTITPRTGFNPYNLPGCSGAFGIALDETTDILWVADSAADLDGDGDADSVVRAYDTTTWTEDTTKSFTPRHAAVDVAVDRLRGFVYTVSMTAYAWTPPGTGSNLISKYDLATGTETTVDTGHECVGVAVDEVTGYVYVTGGVGTGGDNLEVWDTSTSPWNQLQTTGDLGAPAGIYIPQEEVAYNPLNLEKDDGLAGACVDPGDTITYTISFNNLANNYTVYNVTLTDTYPPETTFVSATGGGGGYPWSHDPVTRKVTWDIGNLPALAPTDSVTLTVTVKPGTTPGITITNYAAIEFDNPYPPPPRIATTVTESTDICTAPPIPVGGFRILTPLDTVKRLSPLIGIALIAAAFIIVSVKTRRQKE